MKNNHLKVIPVLNVLWGLSQHYNLKYCYPSQNKILELLESRYDVKIVKSTLNRWLKNIEQSGFIVRTRRISYNAKKGMIFKSTLYKFKKKAMILLLKMGVRIKRAWCYYEDSRKKKQKPFETAVTNEISFREFISKNPAYREKAKSFLPAYLLR